MSPDHWSKLTWDTASAGGYDLFDPIGYLDRKRDRAYKQRVIVTCMKLRSQLVPQTLAETIERIRLLKTALNLKDHESVNMVDSMMKCLCQLTGINATMNKLDENLTGMAGKTGEKREKLQAEKQPEGVYSTTYMQNVCLITYHSDLCIMQRP